MIARYKGVNMIYGFIHFKPGSIHTIEYKRKFLPSKYIWVVIDGIEQIPYTLEGLLKIWETVE